MFISHILLPPLLLPRLLPSQVSPATLALASVAPDITANLATVMLEILRVLGGNKFVPIIHDENKPPGWIDVRSGAPLWVGRWTHSLIGNLFLALTLALFMGIYHAVHDHCRHHAQPQVHPEGHTTGAEEAPPAEEISPTEKTSPAEKTSSTKIKSSVEKTFSVKQTSPVRETPHIGETLPTEETSQADKSSWAERYFWLPSVTAIVQRLLRVWDEPIKRSMLVVALAVLSHVFLDTLGEDPHAFVRPLFFLSQHKASTSPSHAAPSPMPTATSPPLNHTIISPGLLVHALTWTFSIDSLLSLVTIYIYILHPSLSPFSRLNVTAVASFLMLIEGGLYLPRPISLETAMASSLSVALWSMVREVCGGWFVGKLLEGCEAVRLGGREIDEVKEMLDKGIEAVASNEERFRESLSRGRERARSVVNLMSERLKSLSRSAQQVIQKEKGDDQGQINDAALPGHGESENGTDSTEKLGEPEPHPRDSWFQEHDCSHSYSCSRCQDKQPNDTLHPQDSHAKGMPKREESNRSRLTPEGSMEKTGETLARESDGKGGRVVGRGKTLEGEEKGKPSRSSERGKEKEGGRREWSGTRKTYIHKD